MPGSSFTQPYSHVSARQDAFSLAYVRAVAAVAGCSVAVPEPDNDKIDLWLGSRVQGTRFTKPQVHIQIKCQMSGLAITDPIPYALDIDTYDSLRDMRVTNPRIIVLVLAPSDLEGWMMQDEAQLALKHCAYWKSLSGAKEVKGQQSKTVYFPRENVFSPRVLQAMMVRASNGENFDQMHVEGELL